MAEFWFYTGSNTRSASLTGEPGPGINLCCLDGETGALTHRKGWSDDGEKDLLNPSYLRLDLPNNRLYAVRACPKADGPALLMFALDPATRELKRLDRGMIEGEGPCHVDVNPAGTIVATANYPTGNVSVFEVLPDGKFGRSGTIQHEGSGPNAKRQAGPHAHCILFTGPNEFLATDLGADKVFRYRVEDGVTDVAPVGEPIRTEPGAGPRHIIPSADSRYLFILNELDSTLNVARDGKIIAKASTLPPGFEGSNTCAAIHKSNDDRFLYASNRGHDSIAIFAWDSAGETLEPRGHHPTAGHEPRDFSLTPDDNWLVAANQNSHTLVSFRRDAASGMFSEPVGMLELKAAVCVKFVDGS